MRFIVVLTAAMAAACGVGTNVQADVLYSGGDLGNGWSYNMNLAGGYFDKIYSNITVPTGQTWTITGFEAYVADPSDHHGESNPAEAVWDIRTGMGVGAQGTSVLSGRATNTTYTYQGFESFGWEVYFWTVELASPIVLEGGQTYWIAVTPDHPEGFNAGMMWGNGNNSVGGPVDNSSIWWIHDWYFGHVVREERKDMSLKVIGTVPEPASLAVLGLGLLAAARRRRSH